MTSNDTLIKNTLSKEFIDLVIRIGLIGFLVYASVKIVSPFLGILLWGLILAVTLYPIHQKLVGRFSLGQGKAATLLVLTGILIIGVPATLLGGSAVEFAEKSYTSFKGRTVLVKPPPPSVAEWPLIGPKVYKAWEMAASDRSALMKQIRPLIEKSLKIMLGTVAGVAGGLLQFLFSMVIAGIMMAFGESGSRAMWRILRRFGGPEKGDQLFVLSTATIRSVSMGVIGVALIQSLLLGVGFAWAGVPAAGLLAMVVLVFGIAQLPAAVISLPVIGYLWWANPDATMSNIFFSIYLLIAGMADNVLKPLMLGRGVDAPMPVILIGALGGMVSGGLVGLFVGAVLLALAYVIFMDWVAEGEEAEAPETAPQGQAGETAVT
ncbi:MAG TPA: AI-2E family transporter [Thiolapillus brandeum]|uniref:AI-2E family transporter n=1 Tax=Thiolapillus brandeum TaxID=1076588 RepID=A0A831RYG7_9GAMM|nr:AI-2E family transporter [Thiolapillus brandeum]